MEDSHALKFVMRGRTFREDIGKRTFPQQTYGVSQQSPEHFKGSYTLQGDNGYLYRHQNAPQFEYFSQKRHLELHGVENQEELSNIHLKRLTNPICFHRKKGRLGEFMDKNGWMAEAYEIMGDQRDQIARSLSNRDRDKRIKSLKPKIKYENKSVTKPLVNQEYYNNLHELMGEKVRIRKKRNSLANSIIPAEIRTIPQAHLNSIEIETTINKMAKTTMDWYSTKSQFYSKKSETSRTNRRSGIQKRKPILIEQPLYVNGKQSLEDWYKTSCSSKWGYKPKKLDQQEREQLHSRMQISTRE